MHQDQSVAEFFMENWLLILGVIIGYVEIRFKVASHGKQIDQLQRQTREDLREIRDDIKELLKR